VFLPKVEKWLIIIIMSFICNTTGFYLTKRQNDDERKVSKDAVLQLNVKRTWYKHALEEGNEGKVKATKNKEKKRRQQKKENK